MLNSRDCYIVFKLLIISVVFCRDATWLAKLLAGTHVMRLYKNPGRCHITVFSARNDGTVF
jgi:hypothetical protein